MDKDLDMGMEEKEGTVDKQIDGSEGFGLERILG
jgi:hypothetical protein